jgi:carboxymethylenebutenolidase
MGGGLSLALATHMAKTKTPLKAAVSCYGTPPGQLFDVREITTVTPVQGHFGGKVTRKDEMQENRQLTMTLRIR